MSRRKKRARPVIDWARQWDVYRTGDVTQMQIAESVGVSERTVIRQFNRIRAGNEVTKSDEKIAQ